MKKITTLLILFYCVIITAQTPITDANIKIAVNTCLSTNPIDGMCSESEYGAMPSWDVSNVTNMNLLFRRDSSFNGDLSAWNVGNVTNMVGMFTNAASFNGDISAWNVSKVTLMDGMFYEASSFNRDISSWDVSNVTTMRGMFYSTTDFNQDLSNWCVTNIASEPIDFSQLSEANKPIWGTCPTTSLSANDQSVTNISMYPNPVVNKLFIQGLSDVAKVSIYNILGKLVLSKTTSNTIDVAHLQSGMYIVKIVDQQKETVKKFMKK